MREDKSNQMPTEKSCVIIGAGLAGLSAAYRLKKKNWTVAIVEARDRIGGRVFTHHFRENPELYCELGGEWVGNDHEAIIQLCKELKLDLIKHQFEYSFAELGTIEETIKVGAWPFQKRMRKKLKTEMQETVFRGLKLLRGSSP